MLHCMRIGCLCSLLVLPILCGCKHESTITARSSCFDLCLDASAHVDVEGEIGIAMDLRDGFERAQGGLAASVSVAGALTQFVQSMVDLKAGLPSGLSYEGGGVYSMQPNADTQVQIRFYLPASTSFGAAGDAVGFDLFDPASYFTSLGVKAEASIGLSGISTKLSFTFSSLGPGAELLGIAPNASSPVPIDVNGFSSHLANVIIGAQVSVSHASDRANIAFSLVPERKAVSATGSGSATLAISEFSGQGFEFAQTLRLDSIDLNFQSSTSAYDGVIHASALGPDFGFQMLLNYDQAIQGDITLGCLGVEL